MLRKKGFYFNTVIETRGAVIYNNLKTINPVAGEAEREGNYER